MSGTIKKIGKAFKPVLKVAKKIAVPLLIAGAVVITAGAAAGLAIPMLGITGTVGFAGTAAQLVTTLGLTATAGVGSVLTGALTYGTYGALAGAAVGAGTGKNILKSAGTGALIGGAVGGAAAGFGVGLPGLPAAGTPLSAGLPAAELASAAPNSLPLPGLGASGSTTTGLGASTVVKGVAKDPSFWTTAGGGGVISGLGSGITGAMQASGAKAAGREERNARTANYAGMTGAGLMKPSDLVTLNSQPERRSSVGGSGLSYKYMYDAETGQILKVPA